YWVGPQFGEKVLEHWISSRLDLPIQAMKDMCSPFADIADPTRKIAGMKAEPKNVRRSGEQARRYAEYQGLHYAICHDQIPMAIDGKNRVGGMGLENCFDGASSCGQIGMGNVPLR